MHVPPRLLPYREIHLSLVQIIGPTIRSYCLWPEVMHMFRRDDEFRRRNHNHLFKSFKICLLQVEIVAHRDA